MDGLHDLIVIEPDLTDLEMQVAQPGAEILRRGIGLYDPELSPEKPGEDESGFIVRTSRPFQHVQKPFVLCLVELEIVVIPAWIGTAGPSSDLLCHRIFDFEVRRLRSRTHSDLRRKGGGFGWPDFPAYRNTPCYRQTPIKSAIRRICPRETDSLASAKAAVGSTRAMLGRLSEPDKDSDPAIDGL